MRIHSHGLLSEVAYLPSPNQDSRPTNTEISLIVIHGISVPPGEFGNKAVSELFTNALDPTVHSYYASIHHLRVSSHCVIQREGTIIQYVPFTQRAWHAGLSSFQGVDRCNDYSIGVELEGTDQLPYTLAQYEQLAYLVNKLIQHYPAITTERVVGHSDIAPGRKTDPGIAFQWSILTKLLNSYLG